MFDWLKRLFQKSDADDRKRFFDMADGISAEVEGGEPVTIERHLGSLSIRSGVLTLGDPQYLPDLEIGNIDADKASLVGRLWQYPSGHVKIVGLTIALGHDEPCDAPCKIGEIVIDSASLVVVDKSDFEEHWTATGKDRIGVITTGFDPQLLSRLTTRFKLKTEQVNPLLAETTEPVSEQLESEIIAYLESVPKYADFPFLYFGVRTNNSSDRVRAVDKPWDFIPVGDADEPLMFVCGTGRGDGCYHVHCQYAEDVPRRVTIDFLDDVASPDATAHSPT